MRAILFCNLPYAFSILKPLADALDAQGSTYVWYLNDTLLSEFPYSHMPHTTTIQALENFKSDAIFVCGNDVPYWLQGVKVQIFHGLAGEKKGHFRIRDYFDLYLTQGPYFTKKFQSLAQKHKNFEVVETGWCKLDTLFHITPQIEHEKEQLLQQYQVSHILLYAPTFSPSLTSAEKLLPFIEACTSHNVMMIIKFHDKMDKQIIDAYRKLSIKNLLISKSKDITKLLQVSDIMISDTSSVVYEFLLLNKPVITLNSTSENIKWLNLKEAKELPNAIDKTFQKDPFKTQREEIISLYHPYHDGKSAKRMLDATEEYIEKKGIPTKRKLSLLRTWKMKKAYKS